MDDADHFEREHHGHSPGIEVRQRQDAHLVRAAILAHVHNQPAGRTGTMLCERIPSLDASGTPAINIVGGPPQLHWWTMVSPLANFSRVAGP